MKPEPEEVILTRKDAARLQIETAISLFVAREDDVSAHVLAWAASDMLRGVADHLGVESFHSAIDERVRPERLKEWRSILRKAYNFAKHADRDPDAELSDFRPEMTSWALFAAIHNFYAIYEEIGWKMFLFRHWFWCRNPDILLDSELKSAVKDSIARMGPEVQGPLDVALSQIGDMLNPTDYQFSQIMDVLGPNWADAIRRYD